jgi:hypothetical protein
MGGTNRPIRPKSIDKIENLCYSVTIIKSKSGYVCGMEPNGLIENTKGGSMNANFELLAYELQAERERKIAQRALAHEQRRQFLTIGDRLLAWTGGLLIRWGQRLQSIGQESQADGTLLPVME